MNPLFIGPLSDLIGKVFDKVWPDPEKKASAQMELIRMQQSGELALVQTQLSAILADAQSTDPWTSRARPSFMYVIYTLILMGIPMGFVSAWRPDMAAAVAHGLQMWLAAIPDSLYTLFGVGYLGYTGSRTIEKLKGAA
jgi:glycerol dehydrogenase-like iron-containing ADH family enzyme